MNRAKGLLKNKVVLSNIGLTIMLIVGITYLTVGVARINPLRDTYTVTVNMDRSGGLQPNSDVTYRGFRVGKVTDVRLTEKGVVADAQIEGAYDIPMGGEVQVAALSAAGEQYIDFRPDSDEGPYLEDGSVIESENVKTPVPITQVLENASDMVSSIPPDRFATILDELDKALGGGPDNLRGAINGISVVAAGLDQLLPQTTGLLSNLRVIASTTSEIQPDLQILTNNTGVLFDQVVAADGELREFLDLGPGEISTLGGVVAETADPMTNLLQNFVTIARAGQLRAPALAALFPGLRDGTAALAVPAYNGEFHTVLDIWPRSTCEYDTVPVSPAKVGDGRVRLWNYCETTRPELQIRGAANAPRPIEPNNGSSIPPNVDPNQLSTLLPGR
ncbi:MCE family protein [Antrihabitans sp. YC3-6]|uniref:MCE family protein n=1 Tax=Antrihabitans stalagmiti TaxID=2799499 RepID=A0A934NW22_9NOCA|nr:MlaD family protein [Antrihabitans stalagmiti]MBJ8342628.1 MCE family protein [Antrihabitans stalagmiti]